MDDGDKSVRIRRAQATDFADWARMRRLLWPEITDGENEVETAALLADDGWAVFVADAGQGLVGFVATSRSGSLETKAFGIIFDPDQLVAAAPELVAAGKNQTAFASIKNFDSLCVRTKIKRNPSLPGRVVILVVAAADEAAGEHISRDTKAHADP